MRILFVIPPYRTCAPVFSMSAPMPYAAVIMGTILREAGHEVQILDFMAGNKSSKCERPACMKGKNMPPYIHYGTPIEECCRKLDEVVPKFDAVGLCVSQCNIIETSALIGRHIKSLHKPLLIGGPFVTTSAEQAMDATLADAAVRGEGELACVDAFERVACGESFITDNKPVMDLDAIPMPDWSLAPLEDYRKMWGKTRGVLIASRGCPWLCDFCSVWTITGRKHRRMSRERITEQLTNLWDHGARIICFLDDNLFISEKAVDEVLGAIEDFRKLRPKAKNCSFFTEEGIEIRMAAKPGVIDRISKAGFKRLVLGLETLNKNALHENQKPYNREELRQAVLNCEAAGCLAYAFYIVGFIQDTVGSVCADLVEFGKLGLAVRANNLKMLPGTGTTQKFLDAGYIDLTYDWRLSSFYTPDRPGLSYDQIRKLRTILRAIGMAVEDYGVKVFADSEDEVAQKLGDKGLLPKITNGSVIIQAKRKLYSRAVTTLRYVGEMLVLRQGFDGARSRLVDPTTIIATESMMPKDEFQMELVKVLKDG